MKKIVTIGSLILFVGHICVAESLTFTNDEHKKYDGKSLPVSERIDESNNGQGEDKAKIQETSQAQVAEPVSEADKKIIAQRCKEVWNLYRAAISRGDIDEILKYVSSGSQEEFRRTFIEIQNRTPEQDRSDELGEITTTIFIEASSAQFNMRSKAKTLPGDSVIPGYSVGDFIALEGYLNFTKEPDGDWKVSSY